MAAPGSAEESLRLADHYRRLTDDELIALAHQKEKLTEQAQHALAMEICSRRLTVPTSEPKAPRDRVPIAELVDEEDVFPTPSTSTDNGEIPADENDPYAEERQLVEIRKVWSEADARRLQYVLDVAGVPFFMGREKATSVDDVTSKFAEGVPVGVMQIGVPWAIEAIKRNYFPQDERPEPKYEDAGDVAIRCPKCRSTEVIFHELVHRGPDASAGPKYRWTCDVCGNEWKDEGVETDR